MEGAYILVRDTENKNHIFKQHNMFTNKQTYCTSHIQRTAGAGMEREFVIETGSQPVRVNM